MRFAATTLDLLKLELEREFNALVAPKSPVIVPGFATSDMPPAASYPNGVIRNTTLDVLAVSNGTAWIRQDSGAAIA